MQGKTIVVTGGFGALGRVVAEVAAARGASVAILDHAPGPPDGMAERLGPDALMIGGLDLSSADVATKAMGECESEIRPASTRCSISPAAFNGRRSRAARTMPGSGCMR